MRCLKIAVTLTFAALVAACSSATPGTPVPPTSFGTSSAPAVASVTETSESPVEPAAPALASALTTGTPLEVTGRYEDRDGFQVDVTIKIYPPVLLSADDLTQLDPCPEHVPDLTTQLSGTSTTGAYAQGWTISYTSPNPQFPFPLDQLDGETHYPSASYVADPAIRTEKSCLLPSVKDSAEFLGVASLLPPPQATPNNPDRKIELCDTELRVQDDVEAVANIAKWPTTKYGPLEQMGGRLWNFPLTGSLLKDNCTTSS